MLTPREREVLQLTADGYTNGESAELLSISKRTVEAHRVNITRRLGRVGLIKLVQDGVMNGYISHELPKLSMEALTER